MCTCQTGYTGDPFKICLPDQEGKLIIPLLCDHDLIDYLLMMLIY